MKLFKILTCVIFHSIIFHSFSQTLDPDFQLPVPVTLPDIIAIKIQSDGKILVGGNIQFFENQRVNNLIRLNSDGTSDETFTFTPDTSTRITHINLLSTGEIIVSTDFALLKLSNSGQILGVNDSIKNITSVNIQEDDKIIITASEVFTQNSTNLLYRFNSDLTPDNTFNQNNSFNGWVFDAALQNDNIIVLGTFTEVNDITKNNLVRFDSNGNLDDSFDTGSGTTELILELTVQPDGKILLPVSYITTFNGIVSNSGILRLNANGSVDTEFIANSKIISTSSKAIFQGSDILIGGHNKEFRNHAIYRLKNNGNLDSSFTPIQLSNYGYVAIANDNSNNFLLFDPYNPASEYGFLKFSKDGQIDQNFNPELGKYGEINTADYLNGQLVVGGNFIRIGNVQTRNLAKIYSDGTVSTDFIIDPSLTANAAINRQPSQIKIIDDHTVFVSLGNQLVKLNEKGEVDEQFISSGIENPSLFVERFHFLANGQIVTASSNGVFMLNPDGTQLSSFNIPKFNASSRFGFGTQSNGIIYTSSFTKVNDLDANGIVRLNWDGSVDQTFNIGSGPNQFIYDINVIENDDIVLTGNFKQFNGIDAKGLVKLSKNGQVIQSFTDNFNNTFPDEYSLNVSPVKSFRDGFVIGSFIKNPFSSTISFVNADGTFNPDLKLPNEITKVEKDIIPIVGSADTLFLLSKFQVNGNTDPSFVLRLIFNDKPIISGTTSTLSTPEETPLKLTLDNLLVTDADSNFPDDFTFIIHEGENYSVDSSSIIPNTGFVGNLTVPVTVSDGKNESDIFNLSIEVTLVEKIPLAVTMSGDSTITNDPFVSITFSEDVYGFQPADISITNGVVSDLLTEDSLTFTAIVAPIADGKITLEIPAGVVYNKVGTTNQASNIFTFEYDGTSPTVKLSSSGGDTSSVTPFSVAITFSEPVTGFTSASIQVSNATLSELVTTDSINFMAQILPVDFGKVTVKILSGAAQDQAGNENEASQELLLYYQEPYFSLTIEINTPNQEALPSVTATLYQKIDGQFAIIAEQEISNTLSLSFEELPADEYTVGIRPDDMNFLPAYLGNKVMLWDAKILILHQDTLQEISLIPKPVNSSEGESTITGVLLRDTDGGNGRILADSATAEGEILAGIPVYLMHPDTHEILSYAVTDQQGKFSFSDLQAGDYLFLADHEGLPNDEEQNLLHIASDHETLTITVIAGNNIRVTDIQTEKQVTAVEDEIPHHTIQYYPNPVEDELSIIHTSSWLGGEIRISDASGKLLKIQTITSKDTIINLEKMSAGIYFITLSKGNDHHAFKIFKQ